MTLSIHCRSTDNFILLSCFPHVINIAVQTGLKSLTKVMDSTLTAYECDDEEEDEEDDEGSWIPPDDDEYAEALASDPVAKCRTLVTSCRASGQRCEDFAATIEEGNTSKVFDVRCVQLLKDVET